MTWDSLARKKITFNCFRHSFFARQVLYYISRNSLRGKFCSPTQPSIHPALSLSSSQRPSAPYLCVLGFCRWQNEFDSIWIFLFGKNPLPLPLALSLPCLSVTHSPVTHTQSYRVFFHWSRSKSSSKRNWSHPIKNKKWQVALVKLDPLWIDCTWSVEGGTGCYLVVLGQYRMVLVGTWWYWIKTGRYWLPMWYAFRKYLVYLV